MKCVIYRIVNQLPVSEDRTVRDEADTKNMLAILRRAYPQEIYTAFVVIDT